MSGADPVVLLSGGTGGAKLAHGLQARLGDELVVVANTGDDVEIHGGYVSPDPDLVTFWLAERIDERGWGLDGDTFHVMDGLRELGDDVWFNLGDRDLALCVRRARRLAEGATLSETYAEATAALGVRARVLPPSDDQVRTRVRAADRWWDFQEFMIRGLREHPDVAIQDVTFEGAERATPSDAVLEAIEGARAIVVGPSNPIISIGPMLAVPGLRAAIARTSAPVVAVSPLVDGAVLKGPTAAFLAWSGVGMDATGIAKTYEGLLDGMLTDESPDLPGLAVRTAPTLMDDAPARLRVADAALDLADAIAEGRA